MLNNINEFLALCILPWTCSLCYNYLVYHAVMPIALIRITIYLPPMQNNVEKLEMTRKHQFTWTLEPSGRFSVKSL